MCTHPVLGRLAHERALVAAGARVALDRVAARAHEVVQARQLDDDGVERLLVERPLLEEVAHELTLEREAGAFLRAREGGESEDGSERAATTRGAGRDARRAS